MAPSVDYRACIAREPIMSIALDRLIEAEYQGA
jgi:hypothetical protein